ncbi:hypothetical protein [Kitasatospora sp. NPDC050463]|uniref:hypothetical protein n=1 Tax=Kitasatospora sp. NPDC050463 TaxID=3155786 RepID=UPI0033E00527
MPSVGGTARRSRKTGLARRRSAAQSTQPAAVDDGQATGYDALAYCAKAADDQCSGRYLSDNNADRAYRCQAQPAPDPATCRRLDDHAGPSATTAKKS